MLSFSLIFFRRAPTAAGHQPTVAGKVWICQILQEISQKRTRERMSDQEAKEIKAEAREIKGVHAFGLAQPKEGVCSWLLTPVRGRVRLVTVYTEKGAFGLSRTTLRIDQGVGSTSGIRACALRYFDLGKMELENSQNNSLAKLPILKLGEYEMWEIRIKQYFQIQDYALWEVIENGNSWVPIPVTAPDSGPSTALKMTVPSTTEEKICKKNDVKARSLLLMALPNEHQLTFNQLQKLVSRLAILGVDTPAEDLNVKFLRSLPSEWDTHVVVWMNKPDFETMGLDDLYNNFKIVEQKVKRTVAGNNDDKNLAFLTTSSSSSTNPINTVNTGVSTGTTKVNTAGTETSTASFSDATVYAFLSTQPQGSQLVHEDLEQIHDDDLEEMDLKWNMALLSMRARKFYQRTWMEKVIAREVVLVPRSKDNRNWNQGNSSKAVRIEDASEKAMCAIDGGGFDWSDMAEDEVQANMALMAFTDSEVTDKSKRGFGYTAVPSPHPLILNRPTPLDLSYSGLEEFQHPEINGTLKRPKREYEWPQKLKIGVSDDEEDVESIPKEEKQSNVPIATKKESVKPISLSRRSVRYAEMYRSQRPKGNQRSWNGQKSHQLGVLLRSVNTVRPVSTARFVNTVRPYNTAHPKPTVSCARPKTHFQNQAQRPFYKNTTLTKRSNIQNINTAKQVFNTVRPNVNTVRARGFNAVKPSACWVWRPIKPNGASLTFNKYNYIDACDTPIKSQRSGIPLCSATS
ncbi:hypothetical protein Tco_1383670 [Tanacetum coccineum]